MRDSEGVAVGEHHGLAYYTIGQRQGLGIGGLRGRPETPWYVMGKELDNNVLVVTQHAAHLERDWLIAESINWLEAPDRLPVKLNAKIRYRQADQACELSTRADGRLRVHFERPQRAITPGQYVCFYDGPQCLGGGVISL